MSGASIYTSNAHWIVVADIRDTQKGSALGYDVYVVTSSNVSRGWNPIETVVNYFENSAYYGFGYYIQ